jgi:hypothetical protein
MSRETRGVRRSRTASLAAILAVAALCGAAAPAQGAVTIGANVDNTTVGSLTCGQLCTATNLDLLPHEAAAGGVASPIDGVITRWRIRAGFVTGPVALRVLRNVSGGSGTGAGTGPTVTPAADAITAGPGRTRLL